MSKKVPSVLFTVLVTILSNSAISRAHEFSFSELKTIHAGYLEEYKESLERESLTGSSGVCYNSSYWLHGMLSAVEGTGDEEFLILAMHYIDLMVSKAQDLNGDGLLEWDLGWGGANLPSMLNHLQIGVAIARAAAIIMQNDTFRAKYHSRAQDYVSFVDNSCIQWSSIKGWGFDYVPQTKIYPGWPWPWPYASGYISWLPQDLGGNGMQKIWPDLASHLGAIGVLLSQARNSDMYIDIATRVGEGFRRKLEFDGIGYNWDSDHSLEDWQSISWRYQEAAHDTSHANREPMMMVFMYEANVAYVLEDIKRMANTLTGTIWNGSVEDPMFSNYINGSNKPFGDLTESGDNGCIYIGWALLSKYDQKARKACMAALEAIMQGKDLGLNNSVYGRIALSGHLLRCFRIGEVIDVKLQLME